MFASDRELAVFKLSIALKTGVVSYVRHVLSSGTVMIDDLTNGCTLLFHACWHGYLEMCHILVAHDADVNVVCHDELDFDSRANSGSNYKASCLSLLASPCSHIASLS